MTISGYTGDTPAEQMPPPLRVPSAFTRTAGEGRPVTPEGRVRALVHQIAADPALVAWLREHVAGQVDGVAAYLDQSAGPWDPEATCTAIRSRADAHRRGETPLW